MRSKEYAAMYERMCRAVGPGPHSAGVDVDKHIHEICKNVRKQRRQRSGLRMMEPR